MKLLPFSMRRTPSPETSQETPPAEVEPEGIALMLPRKNYGRCEDCAHLGLDCNWKEYHLAKWEANHPSQAPDSNFVGCTDFQQLDRSKEILARLDELEKRMLVQFYEVARIIRKIETQNNHPPK